MLLNSAIVLFWDERLLWFLAIYHFQDERLNRSESSIWYNFYSQKTWKHNFQHQLNKSLHFLEPLLNEDKFCNIWFFSRNELWIVMVSSTLECCIIYFKNWTTYLLPLPLRRLMQHVLSCDKRHSGTVGGCFQKLRQLFVLSA
jgi:hypothetical protein